MGFRWLPKELRKERLLGGTGLLVAPARLFTVRTEGVREGPDAVYVGNGASLAMTEDEPASLIVAEFPEPAVGVGLSRARLERAEVVLGPDRLLAETR